MGKGGLLWHVWRKSLLEDGLAVTHQDLPRTTLDTVTIAQVMVALERGYEGYAVPVRFTVEALLRRIRSEHIDLTQSYLFLDEAGEACGGMLIARRGRNARIAALGVAPRTRGSGIGRRAVELALADARTRGDRCVILEVLSANTGAQRLYQRCGFVERRTLVGYERPAQPSSDLPNAAIECKPQRVLGDLLSFYPQDVSWQIAPEGFAGSVPPVQAFRSAAGAVALVEPAGAAMRLLAFAVPPGQRRQGNGRRFMLSLADRFAGMPWTIPAMVPETLAAPFLAATGWRRTALTQIEMDVDV